MQKRILSYSFVLLIGIVIGDTVLPALSQQVGQKMMNTQKEFEELTMEKKLATLNMKLDYLIKKGLPMGLYIDSDGVVQRSVPRVITGGSTGPVSGGGSFRLEEPK